jgi:hypothetical protein
MHAKETIDLFGPPSGGNNFEQPNHPNESRRPTEIPEVQSKPTSERVVLQSGVAPQFSSFSPAAALGKALCDGARAAPLRV